ncbi:hypothetical protein CPC735_056540 [Coccidioides posadasii C735 delta SOWgp]|uniref:tRNA (adenine(58)-N(1))-methyltransferase catalytic subunit TRM61 n=1 Tax=Coccidioides posadasii (strain C735) TaxID=222929 RepID=C5PID1_COCP7|nr:hypothetical protein CPC735_056540 [Coccidioides posadasii C735 delta SOWgp]EER24284.1 hypothetical protein CPC735_056540 [Coccidioides posadasii C735 delta SOWgp]|eukprot:XP_003066429.1 hypothetical protein CPC735_056540 [Coccidioides posadasii C735 delta SOWgp]
MSKFLSNLRRFLTRSKIPSSYGGSIDTNFSKFQEGDVVIINGRNPSLTKALGRNKQTGVSRGVIQHNDIIGRRPRDLVKAQKDIHTSVPSDQREPDQPVEILEAGTGHGSLTLHLSRAINGANTCPPPIPAHSQLKIIPENSSGQETKSSKREGQQISDESSLNQEAWDSWRSGRRAIIHTVEISAKHSAHAEKIIRGFRRGMYAGNIDFYVASVENWIEEQTRRRNRSLFSGTLEPFLSYAILDMPSAHLRIPHVSPILKVDGVLAVFMPNVTQIGDCVKIINDKRLPLVLEKAVELGTGISSGRLWDIRMAVRRSRPVKTKEAEQPTGGENGEESSGEVSESKTQDVYTSALAGEPQAGDPVLVCRPKVGERIVGGGFVGLWRRINEQ